MAEVIKFSRVLYRPEAIEAAADAYAELVDIDIDIDDDNVTVTLDNPDPELGEVVYDGFANHALFESIVMYRAESGKGATG